MGLSTYPQYPHSETVLLRKQRERKKGPKKERETTATIFNQKVTFLSGRKGDISIWR